MAKKLYEENSVKAIADAIRSKNESTDTYKIAEMAAAIEALMGGVRIQNIIHMTNKEQRLQIF